MPWLSQAIWWYLTFLFLGVIFFPFTQKLFGKFFYDAGYPFAKTVAILAFGYILYLSSNFGILPFSRSAILLVITIFIVLNAFLMKGVSFNIKKITIFVLEEAIFIASFVLWIIVRGQEPSIRGLEKFMDFGFMNSIARSPFMPPADIWYAGEPINYYYFGHFTFTSVTKLTGIDPSVAYNVILATIFALAVTHVFSLGLNLFLRAFDKLKIAIFGGVLATFLVNFGGNLHTIYAFTKGYNPENPTPFWEILSGFNAASYWYPNATRFIPLTIHEFPIYSYVVADLHGHVFDIPFILFTLALLALLFLRLAGKSSKKGISPAKFVPLTALLGAMAAVHYMTNAFDGPIYLLLISLSLLVLLGFGKNLLIAVSTLALSFVAVSIPFTAHFTPFVTGIGVNCPPQFLVELGRLGPFLFESENCQISLLWMMSLLWGFFWFNFLFLMVLTFKLKGRLSIGSYLHKHPVHFLFVILMSFGAFLIAIPETFYIKDIYPAHFRANTMFKLGYQAFMVMAFASSYVFLLYKSHAKKYLRLWIVYFSIFVVGFVLVAIYPNFAIKSFYGTLSKKPQLDGTAWVQEQYPDYKEIIHFFNSNVLGQPVILEAQGDSYTDFNIVSSYTGLPTVAGWWVHEWLWRGDSQAVGNRIPDIEAVYSDPISATSKAAIAKYKIQYIIVGPNEREKYKDINEEAIANAFRQVFVTSSGLGTIYHTTYRP